MPIGSSYQEIRERTIAAVDKAFAEPIRISFLVKKGGAVDPARPMVEINAPLRVGGGEKTNVSGGYAGSWRTQLASGKAEMHIDRATYTGSQIKPGDRVRALSRRGQPWWEVLRVDDRSDTRLVLELGEI